MCRRALATCHVLAIIMSCLRIIIHIVIMVVLILLLVCHLLVSCIIVGHVTRISYRSICVCILPLWVTRTRVTLVGYLSCIVLPWVSLLCHELLVKL